jgi:hypothetical protein
MAQGDELELQRSMAADPEREQGNESGQNRDHAPDAMVVVPQNLQSSLAVHSFEQGGPDEASHQFLANLGS